MSESQVQKVVIVGGGITGGVLALALAQKGVEVVLVDLRRSSAASATASPCRATRSRPSTRSASTTSSRSAASRSATCGCKTRRRARDRRDPHAPDGRAGPAGHHGRGPRRHRRHPGRGGRRGRRRRTPRDDAHRDRGPRRLGHRDALRRPTETVDLLVGADGIRSKVRAMIGIEDRAARRRHGHLAHRRQAAGRRWTARSSTTAARSTRPATPPSPTTSATPSCSRRTSTAPSSARARTARVLKERGQGYGGIWGEVRDSLADDAIVNYQWIEAICVDSPGTAAARSSSATPPTPARR